MAISNLTMARTGLSPTAMSGLAAAVATGALQGIAFPPFGFVPAILVFLVPLLAVLGSGSARRDAFLGWLAGAVFWAVAEPWLVDVMVNYGGLSRPTGIAFYLALSAYLGCWTALFGWIAGAISRSLDCWARAVAIPAAWCLCEWLRGSFGMGGFPWNLTAYALAPRPRWIQGAEFVGSYGVGFLIVFANLLVLGAVRAAWRWRRRGEADRGPRRVCLAHVGCLAVLLLTGAAFGSWRLGRERGMTAAAGSVGADGDGILVAALQPNVGLVERWDPTAVTGIYDTVFAMSREAAAAGAQWIVWPESAIPLRFDAEATYRADVIALARQTRTRIVLGSIGTAENLTQAPPRSSSREGGDTSVVYNATYLIEPDGAMGGQVNKEKLVPFGEYVPARRLLGFAEPLVREVGSFTPGRHDVLLGRDEPRLGMAVCFEIVFPELAAQSVRSGARALVTITNDSWYGTSGAPRQHWNAAVLRAVETRRAVIRAAATGISGIIAPSGQTLAELPLGHRGIALARVEVRQDLTPAARWPLAAPLGSLLVTAIAIIAGWKTSSPPVCKP